MESEEKKKSLSIFVVREIRGENMEEICDGVWEAFNKKEKLRALEKAGYDLNC